jgi:hypothetical protein
MNMITKGYHWYHDTPEQPFKLSQGSIWLINPDTKEWMLHLKKLGHLWYHYKTPESFSKYLNMEESDFKSFFKIWVEDVLERRVVSTIHVGYQGGNQVKDVLKNGKQMK